MTTKLLTLHYTVTDELVDDQGNGTVNGGFGGELNGTEADGDDSFVGKRGHY